MTKWLRSFIAKQESVKSAKFSVGFGVSRLARALEKVMFIIYVPTSKWTAVIL
jgi:hypothetical protein